VPPAGEPFARLIPYRNVPALVGYYLGVFSAVPFLGLPLMPAAIVLGIVGLVKVRRQPETRGTGHAVAAIVCGVLLQPAVIGLIFLLMDK